MTWGAGETRHSQQCGFGGGRGLKWRNGYSVKAHLVLISWAEFVCHGSLYREPTLNAPTHLASVYHSYSKKCLHPPTDM